MKLCVMNVSSYHIFYSSYNVKQRQECCNVHVPWHLHSHVQESSLPEIKHHLYQCTSLEML